MFFFRQTFWSLWSHQGLEMITDPTILSIVIVLALAVLMVSYLLELGALSSERPQHSDKDTGMHLKV